MTTTSGTGGRDLTGLEMKFAVEEGPLAPLDDHLLAVNLLRHGLLCLYANGSLARMRVTVSWSAITGSPPKSEPRVSFNLTTP